MLEGLVAFAVVLLPFNSLPYFNVVFGEMAGEGAFYPFLFAGLIWLLAFVREGRFEAPQHRSLKLLLFLILWIVFSGMVNIGSIVESSLKGRTGMEKLVLQFVLIVFVTMTALTTYKVLNKLENPLAWLRRFALLSFAVAGTFSIVEVAYIYGSGFAQEILMAVNPFIRDIGGPEGSRLLYPNRVRSVSGEASWFAMYCSFIFPWVLSYLFTEKRRVPVFLAAFAYLCVLIVLTWSRAAYLITVVQIAAFGLMLVTTRQGRVNAGRAILAIPLIAILTGLAIVAGGDQGLGNRSVIDVFLSLTSSENLSNLNRISSQLAAVFIALDHPVFGVGLGQYGFYMAEYIPEWAKPQYEVQLWMSGLEGTPWPPVHALYARLAAETGLVGVLAWLVMWGTVLKSCFSAYKLHSEANQGGDILGAALIASIVGVFLSGFNADSLRFFGYWIILGAAWAYTAQGMHVGTFAADLAKKDCDAGTSPIA